jgi:arginine decarboxylase
MEIDKSQWPIMIISGEFDAKTMKATGCGSWPSNWKKPMTVEIIPSYTYEDGYEIFRSRSDFGSIVVDWDIPLENPKEQTTAERIDCQDAETPPACSHFAVGGTHGRYERKPYRLKSRAINDCIWKTTGTIPFLAGRIANHAEEYILSNYPPFFGAMVNYANQYKFAWHTPGHMGGMGFLRSPAGVAFYKFFGENAFGRISRSPFRNWVPFWSTAAWWGTRRKIPPGYSGRIRPIMS